MELILNLDRELFFLINGLPHTGLTDAVALFFSGIGNYGMIWVMLLSLIFLKEEKRDHRFVLLLLVSIICTYGLTEILIKPLIARIRPEELMGAVVVEYIHDGYSFPSSHAAVAFVGATLLAIYEKKQRILFLFIAAIIAISRIYLGKHYPIDVLVGAGIGYIVARIALLFHHPDIIKR